MTLVFCSAPTNNSTTTVRRMPIWIVCSLQTPCYLSEVLASLREIPDPQAKQLPSILNQLQCLHDGTLMCAALCVFLCCLMLRDLAWREVMGLWGGESVLGLLASQELVRFQTSEQAKNVPA
jgi:hypothetical protein